MNTITIMYWGRFVFLVSCFQLLISFTRGQDRNPEDYHCDSTRSTKNVCGMSFHCFNGTSEELPIWFNYVGHWLEGGIFCEADSVVVFKGATLTTSLIDRIRACPGIVRVDTVDCDVIVHNAVIRGSKILHQYQPDNKTHTGSASYVGFHLENGADYRRATYQGILTLEDGILCKELLLPDEPCSCIVKKFRINGSMNVGVDGGDLVIENSVIDTLIITANGKSLNLTIRNCKVSNLLQIKNAYVGKLKLENVDAAGRIELGSRLNIGSLLLLNVSAASEEAKLVLRYLKISDELRVKGDDLRLNLMCDSAYFASGIDFSGAVFTHSLDLLRASSGGKINLFSTEIANEMMVDERSFRDGLDFSDAIVTGHVKIRLASDYKKYMVGFSWDDYENDFISFQFSDPSLREQNYSKVYRVLRRLLQEHTAIGDDETVLQIAFEIKRFKTEFVGNDADKFMGWLFGFGGVPWTFFWVVSGIIAVCSLLYALVCSDIHGILFDEIVDLPHFRNAIVMVYFSASVFMSLRFKREWLKVSSHLLSVIMVLEYAVGLVLIVLFVVYVANSIPQFEFVKQWLI